MVVDRHSIPPEGFVQEECRMSAMPSASVDEQAPAARILVSGEETLPSRPFKAGELRAFLEAHPECGRIYLFRDGALEGVCAELGFSRHVAREIVSIDLTRSEEELWAGLRAKRRNGIRYARRQGVTVHLATAHDLQAATGIWIEGFCAKYNFPAEDIRHSVAAWIRENSLLLARLGADGPAIAGVAYRDAHHSLDGIRHFRPGIYSMYNANASLAEYQKYKPNDLLVWETAVRMKAKGFHEFVLGSAEAPFKAQFSNRRIHVDEWLRGQGKAPTLWQRVRRTLSARLGRQS
jgi:hypothetical protein